MFYQNVSLKSMLYYAYGAQGDRVIGPDWIGADKFDVLATIPPGTNKNEFTLMLRNLLADRFNLVLHTESKEVKGYRLVLGRGGAKLSVADPAELVSPRSDHLNIGISADGYPVLDRPGIIYPFVKGYSGKAIHLIVKAQTLDSVAKMLDGFVHAPVLNETRLDGVYSFALNFAVERAAPLPSASQREPPLDPDDNPFPNIASAIQQLGLRFESSRNRIDVYVVDRANRTPSAN